MKAIKLLVVLLLTFTTTDSFAVAFKVQNDSKYTFRVRIHDRGNWRPWVTCSPGFWGDVAKSVKRTDHMVEIQILKNNRWQSFHYKSHGSKIFTRVIQFVNNNSQVGIAWWDETPGCRDQPPHPTLRHNSCLKRSGWYKDLIIDGVKWGVTTLMTM